MIKPKKWTEVYPQGTKEGNEEQKFFISLARNPKFEWRSTGMIQKETGLPRKRVEEIIAKYLKAGLIIASPTKEEHWAYWERVPGMLKDTTKSITDADQNNRIDKQSNGFAEMITFNARLFSDAPNVNNEVFAKEYGYTTNFFNTQIISPAADHVSMSCTFAVPEITDSINQNMLDKFTNDGQVPNIVHIWENMNLAGQVIKC